MSKPITANSSISKIPADLLKGLTKAQIEYIQSLQNQVQTLQKSQKEILVIKVKKNKQPYKRKPIRKASIDLVGKQLGFKKKAFREYLVQKNIDLSKFENELDLYPYMKKVVDDENFTNNIQSEGFNIDPPKFNLEHAKNSIQDNLASIGEKLGFDEFDLIEYLKRNHIDVSKFNSPTDLYSFIKSRLDEEKKDENLIKPLEKKKYQEIPPKVKPLEKDNKVQFWQINELLDPSQEDEINQMIEDERKKYGESNYNKHYKMIFNNSITSYKDIIYTLTELFKQMPTMFRLLFSFGVVQEKHHKKTDDKGNIIEDYYTYDTFRPGKNYFLHENVIIKNKQDFNYKVLFNCTEKNIKIKLSDDISQSDIRLIGVYAMGMKVTLLDWPIGSQIILPKYINNSRCIVGLEGVPNNLCFWGCLAIADGARIDRYINKAKELFKSYYGDRKSIESYRGFDFHKELDAYENFNTKFAINILNYNKDKTANVIRHSQFNDSRTKIYLNLYMDHFSFIANVKKLLQLYICETCAKKFKDVANLARHQKICSTEQEDVFVKYPQIYEPKRNTIIELAEWFNIKIDFKYDYLITYDLESLLFKADEKHGKKTKITHRHTPISVSVYDNIPGYSQEYWYCNTDPKKLVNRLFQQLDRLCEKANKLMLEKMKPLTDAIENYYHEKRRERYLKLVHDYCSSVPIIGFNSGFYDTGIMINNNFMQEILKRDKNPIVAKDGNRYKFIKAGKFLFLDEVQYLPPTYNLDKFIKGFDGGESKGFCPYEWLDHPDKLDFPFADLKIEYFHSSLKNSNIKPEDFDWLMATGKRLGWRTVRDLLKWYNNLDVRPFLKACLKQKEFFYPLGLDMYKDGFSLPALSEKIMFAFVFDGFDEFRKKPIEKQNYYMPNNINEKITQYKNQDKQAKRPIEDYICEKDIRNLIKNQSFKCYYCHKGLSKYTWTLDRIECDVAHTSNNCLIACYKCNNQRKDEIFTKFLRKKQLLRYSKVKPMIYLIDEANKEVFYKLKEAITGGASIVFHRYHEADKTEITRVRYDETTKTWSYDKCGKTVKKILGYDCNALYLWSIGEDMLCGKLKWIETDDMKYVKRARKDQFFGMLSVDIRVPENKYNYFSEMCPIFKNMEYSQEECGEYMKNIIKKNQDDPTKEVKYAKTRKLIGTLKGEKLLIKSTRLKWLMKHGCIVEKLHGVIPAERGRIFQKFMDKVSAERRKGDRDEKYKIIGEMWKLVGNSAFGRTGMNKNKHRTVKYCNEMQFNRKKYDYFYYDVNIYDDVYEVFSNKKKIRQNIPIQVAASIYDDSKRRMLEFYYDCVDKYLDRKDFQYVQMDTDSAYMALTGNFKDLVKPELKEEFKKDYNNWFPRTDTPKHYAKDIRTPGLFKPEYEGIGIVATGPKSYYAISDQRDKDGNLILKYSCKGVQHVNNQKILNFESYKNVLFSGKHNTACNKGFRFIDKGIVTYETEKKGISPIYDKRVVMDDGIHTRPLDI